jgi:hypothetical protein
MLGVPCGTVTVTVYCWGVEDMKTIVAGEMEAGQPVSTAEVRVTTHLTMDNFWTEALPVKMTITDSLAEESTCWDGGAIVRVRTGTTGSDAWHTG